MSYEQDQKIELNESTDEREYDVFEIIVCLEKKLTIIIITSFFAVGSVIRLSIKNVQI